MTIITDVGQTTGIELDRASGVVGFRNIEPPETSNCEPDIGGEDLKKTRKFEQSLGDLPSQRITLLGILLAQLQNVSFQDVSTLLGVKEAQLVRFMQGAANIPDRKADQWQLIADILQDLAQILRSDAIGRWLNTQVPDLGGKTPLQMVSAGKANRVAALTRSYLDGSFS
ncbi:MAG: antitoxin Xre/MbcA/ParS toxin-binding domain-containing protein [Microbacteriaceae bacterium]